MNISNEQLQNLLTTVCEENQNLQIELLSIKNKINGYKSSLANLTNLNEDFILGLNFLHGNQKEKNRNRCSIYGCYRGCQTEHTAPGVFHYICSIDDLRMHIPFFMEFFALSQCGASCMGDEPDD